MDPFIVVNRDLESLNNKERKKFFTKKKELGRTEVCQNGHKSPTWSDVIGVPDFADEAPQYWIKVYDCNKLRPDRLIGEVMVDLSAIREIGHMSEADFPLNFKDKPSGTLFMTVNYLKGM